MAWLFNSVNHNAPTSGPLIVAIAIAFSTFSFVAVCSRLYVRAIVLKAVGLDDWAIIVTWFLAFGFTIGCVLQTRFGLGLHDLVDFPSGNTVSYNLIQYAAAPFYITSILGFKLSLLFSFLRIANQRMHKMLIKCLMGLCGVQTLGFLLVGLTLCIPVQSNRDPTAVPGKCINTIPFFITMAVFIMVLDVLVMLTPFPILLSSQLQTRKKLVVLGLFSMGIFITVIQLFRIFTIQRLSNFIGSYPITVWSLVEANLGIIVACIPTLAPLFKAFRNSPRTKYGSKRSGNSGKLSAVASFKLQKLTRGPDSNMVRLDDERTIDDNGGGGRVGEVFCTVHPDFQEAGSDDIEASNGHGVPSRNPPLEIQITHEIKVVHTHVLSRLPATTASAGADDGNDEAGQTGIAR